MGLSNEVWGPDFFGNKPPEPEPFPAEVAAENMNSRNHEPAFTPPVPDGWKCIGWKCLGEAGVDGATLEVSDPTYSDPLREEMGVRFTSGLGDGGYWVWAYMVEDNSEHGWGKRICSIYFQLIAEMTDDQPAAWKGE